MRGGSQSRLIRAADSQIYVAKFSNNPQGRRTLINERVASYLMAKLGISAPDTVLLSASLEIISRENLFFRTGSKSSPVAPGIHLGVKCPVNPETTAIYDMVPAQFYDRVENGFDFGLAYVCDIWTSQTDTRQAIFIRVKPSASLRFRAYMIDHGFAFCGCDWMFSDSPVYRQNRILAAVDDIEGLCHKAVDAILDLSAEEIMAATELIPSSWFDQDRHLLLRLLEQLCTRRNRLASLVKNNLQSKQTKWPYRVD
jgi:hypothetical protein